MLLDYPMVVKLTELKNLISLSESLSQKEKDSLMVLVVYLTDNDLEKLYKVLRLEKEVREVLPELNQSLKTGLLTAFNHTYDRFQGFKKNALQKSEKNQHQKETEQVEQQLKNL